MALYTNKVKGPMLAKRNLLLEKAYMAKLKGNTEAYFSFSNEAEKIWRAMKLASFS